ncbi:putative pectinesterase/pectinesterase inhibitor 51 [Asimina triloba]
MMTPFKKPIFFLAMASLVSLALISLFLLFSLSSVTTGQSPQNPLSRHSHKSPILSPGSSSPQIQQACKATRFPDSCQNELMNAHLPNPPTPMDVIKASLDVSYQNLETAQSMVKTILSSASGDPNMTNAANNCIEVLRYSSYRISLTSSPDVLPSGRTKDARAWMSAAELYQYDCWSALKYVNTTHRVNETMAFLDGLIQLTSNALSMIFSYDHFGNDTAKWRPPMTERSGFWGDSSTNGGEGAVSGFKGGVPAGLAPDATVCKAREGCFRTVQSAVDAAPENLSGGRRFVIHIEAGVYEEIVRVPFEKKNVVFVGDGMGKTVITGKLYVGMVGISTYNTATVGVNGDGFMARDLTIENAAGPDVHQAVAFRSTSDFSVLENCELLGHQDTLYAHSLRQFYKSCRIAGTIDFIFGNSATVLQDCLILVVPRQVKPEKGETNAVCAQGRTDPAQATGFVFLNCVVNGTEEYMALYQQNPKAHRNYLGRPWKEYSRTVFMGCHLESLIRAEGWLPWSGDFALATLFYGEFEDDGPGANPSARVKWSSQIPAEHVAVYSVENFIQGNEWLSSAK